VLSAQDLWVFGRQDVELEILDWKESEDSVDVKWRFRYAERERTHCVAAATQVFRSSPHLLRSLVPVSSCIIDLPWKPKLAAAGSTKHVLSASSGKVVEHIESWDVNIDRVLKSLLMPANRLPTNRWFSETKASTALHAPMRRWSTLC
jgi:hypothetical protein